MNKKLLIFGSHEISEMATYYFNKENIYKIGGYVLDDKYIDKDSFLNKPVIPYSDIRKKFSNEEFCFHVAIFLSSTTNLEKKV